MPPAPATFSTTTCLPRTSPRNCSTMRPSTSTGPPAANGTTMVRGRLGQPSSAAAGWTKAAIAVSTATMILRISAPLLAPHPSLGQELLGQQRAHVRFVRQISEIDERAAKHCERLVAELSVVLELRQS